MTDFTPVREKSQWEYAYSLFEDAKPGDIISYDSLGSILRFDSVKERTKIQQAVAQAAKKLLVTRKIALESVRGTGYRVVNPNEHVRLSRKQQSKAFKAISKGTAVVTNVDMTSLTENEKKLALNTGQALAFQAQQLRLLDIRQKDLEKALGTVVRIQEDTLEDVASQKAKLKALEKRLQKAGL